MVATGGKPTRMWHLRCGVSEAVANRQRLQVKQRRARQQRPCRQQVLRQLAAGKAAVQRGAAAAGDVVVPRGLLENEVTDAWHVFSCNDPGSLQPGEIRRKSST